MSPLFPLFTGPEGDKEKNHANCCAPERTTFVNPARDRFPTISGPDERSL